MRVASTIITQILNWFHNCGKTVLLNKNPNRLQTEPIDWLFLDRNQKYEPNRTEGLSFFDLTEKTEPIKTQTAWPYN